MAAETPRNFAVGFLKFCESEWSVQLDSISMCVTLDVNKYYIVFEFFILDKVFYTCQAIYIQLYAFKRKLAWLAIM